MLQRCVASLFLFMIFLLSLVSRIKQLDTYFFFFYDTTRQMKQIFHLNICNIIHKN